MTTKAGMPPIPWCLATAVFLIKKWKATIILPKELFASSVSGFMRNGIALWHLTILPGKALKNLRREKKEEKFLRLQKSVVASEYMAPGRMKILLWTGIKIGLWAVFL